MKVRIVKLGNDWYVAMNCCTRKSVYTASSQAECIHLYDLHNRLVGHPN